MDPQVFPMPLIRFTLALVHRAFPGMRDEVILTSLPVCRVTLVSRVTSSFPCLL